MNIFKVNSNLSTLLTPLFLNRLPAGFPSTLGDDPDIPLDLNRRLIKNQAATFFVKVTGDSMIHAGIHDDDILVVDRSLKPKNEDVVVAILNGEMTVKRLSLNGSEVKLIPDNPSYPTLEIKEEMEFTVWGVVTSVIHELKVYKE